MLEKYPFEDLAFGRWRSRTQLPSSRLFEEALHAISSAPVQKEETALSESEASQ